MSDETHFKLIDTYFRENTLVDHHLSSCNDFYEKGIFKVFNDMNPIQYYSVFNESTKDDDLSYPKTLCPDLAIIAANGSPSFPSPITKTFMYTLYYKVEVILSILEIM